MTDPVTENAAKRTCWGCEARREHERHTGHICDKNVSGRYEQPVSLFQWGQFVAASGRTLDWKIECDALSPYDWRCLAEIVVPRLPVVQSVVGVPTGGEPFAQAIREVGFDQDAGARRRLIVDDVWTTGSSVSKLMQPDDLVVVAFARNPVGPLPPFVWPIWQLADPWRGMTT